MFLYANEPEIALLEGVLKRASPGDALVTAKVATYGERAEDMFFITDRNGEPVADNKQLYCLASEIYQRLAPTADKVVGLD